MANAQVSSPGVWVHDDKAKCLDGSPPGKGRVDGWVASREVGLITLLSEI